MKCYVALYGLELCLGLATARGLGEQLLFSKYKVSKARPGVFVAY